MHRIVNIEERGISPKKMKISKNKKNAFSDNHMLTSWFKFQLDNSNGVGCSEGAYTSI